MQNTKNILDYLYKLEYFSPFTPTGTIIYNSKENKNYDYNSFKKYMHKEKKITIFNIYFGTFYYDIPLEKIERLIREPKAIEKNTQNLSYITGFKITDTDDFIIDSFSICSFVYAINEILKNNKIDIQLDDLKIKEITNKIFLNSQILDFNLFDPFENFDKLLDTIKQIFKDIAPFIHDEIIITVDYINKPTKKDQEAKLPEGPAILSSFYIHDLMNIKNNLNNKIINYLSMQNSNKIEIEKDINTLQKVLNINNYPLGKWPSTYNISLMQQVAINLALQEKDDTSIFSVNGPPGSGKTTLIKEIVADLIVKRAINMSKYEHPDKAFTKCIIKEPDSYNKYFYKINEDISQFGILVASNNNNAVENISLELPKSSNMTQNNTLTNKFDTTINKEIYFTDLANNINNDDSWGLISVALGHSKNIKNFTKNIWFDQDKKTIRNYFKGPKPNYLNVRKKFTDKLEEVLKYRKFLSQIEEEIKQISILEQKIQLEQEQINKNEKLLNQLIKENKNITNKIDNLKNDNNNYNNLIKEIKNNLSFISKIFEIIIKDNPYITKKRQYKKLIKQNNLQIIDYQEIILNLNKQISNFKDEINNSKITLELDENKLKLIQEKLDFYKKNQIILADSNYYKDITTNKDSQLISPWTNEHYNRLREELFYEALQLHKAFVLNSISCKKNLNLVINALSNSMSATTMQESFKDILNTLYLLVPVISTSLASVSKFLYYIKKDEIGYLIIDEAGQATPASSLGAIYRSKKSIILGDPFQIEPVSNIPECLYHILDYKNIVPSNYHDNTLSCQIIADSINKYGAYRKNDEISTWIGCPLLLHRRCIEPMFSISNQIAYNNTMFYCTNEDYEANLIMDKSTWYDIKGQEISINNHYVKEQGQKVIDIIIKSIDKYNELPNIFIISPFKTVVKAMQRDLYKALLENTIEEQEYLRQWVVNSCGTIHTFQGKEADEVILILGCSKESTGAINWAGKKPNILNVAVSRAKYRLAVIADADIWKNIKYFDILYNSIEKNKYF